MAKFQYPNPKSQYPNPKGTLAAEPPLTFLNIGHWDLGFGAKRSGFGAKRPGFGAKRLPLHLAERNRARDYYNPLRGLDMPRVIRLLEAGERGEHADVQWLYRTVEKRDATLRGLKMRRTSALKKLDWDIKIPDKLPPGITPALADAQAASLRALYDGIGNLPEVFEFLALASFRGFSHLEKRWRDNNPALPLERLVPVPQWHWVRHPQTWAWIYDPKAQGDWSGGVPINPDDFIIRELDDPINEIALICFLRKNMSQKDWDSFVEDFGIPSIFAMLGEGTPADKVKEWLEMMEKVTGNSRGALPPGAKVQTISHGNQGATPFKQHKDEQREELVLAGTGGLLSMLTAPTGLNSDQAGVHEAAFDAIALAESAHISSLLQAGIDEPHLRREFPGLPACAYFELAAVDEEDRSTLGDLLVKLAQAGLESDENEISEKMGLKLRRAAPPPPPGGTPAAPGKPPATNAGADDDANEDEDEDDDEDAPLRNRADAVSAGNEERFYAAAGARLAEADRAALAPLLERVAAIAQTDDAAAGADALEKLRADLPALEKQCLGDAATAELEDAFSAILGAAVADGLATAATGADTGGRPLANMAPRHGDTDWDESDYVRDEEGKFAPKGGGASGASPSRMKGKARERVIAAIKEAHRRKGEVHGAIEITGLGKVSVGLGASGDKDNEFKGGWGAAHWEGKHAESTAVAVADLLTKGRVMPGQTADKREIHHNGWKGVLAKKSKGNWRLVTVFNAGK